MLFEKEMSVMLYPLPALVDSEVTYSAVGDDAMIGLVVVINVQPFTLTHSILLFRHAHSVHSSLFHFSPAERTCSISESKQGNHYLVIIY